MEKYAKAGLMTDTAIREAMGNYQMLIYPFDERNLTPVGYNFTFSNFIVSLTNRAFVNLKTDLETGGTYFNLQPSETVLALTRETIWVNKTIGGTFHSKVSLVTQGLGHISTTLDPGWRGQLLAPLNNPTKRKIRVYVSRAKTDTGIATNNKERKATPCSFITLTMYRCTHRAKKSGDNKPARLELLEHILLGNRRSASRIELAKIISSIGEHFTEYSQKNIYEHDVSVESEEGTFAFERQIGLDSNDAEIRRYVVEEYIDQQRILNTTLHNRYLDVVKINRALLWNHKIKFAAWATVLLVIVGSIGFVLYQILDSQLFAPIIGALVALLSVIYSKLIDKYFFNR